MSAFFNILSGYFLINLSSSISKECAMGIALKIATGEIVQISKIPDTLFSRNLQLLSFPTIYSFLCFPLKWRAYEFFPRGHGRTPAKVRSNLNSSKLYGFLTVQAIHGVLSWLKSISWQTVYKLKLPFSEEALNFWAVIFFPVFIFLYCHRLSNFLFLIQTIKQT